MPTPKDGPAKSDPSKPSRKLSASRLLRHNLWPLIFLPSCTLPLLPQGQYHRFSSLAIARLPDLSENGTHADTLEISFKAPVDKASVSQVHQMPFAKDRHFVSNFSNLCAFLGTIVDDKELFHNSFRNKISLDRRVEDKNVEASSVAGMTHMWSQSAHPISPANSKLVRANEVL